MGGGVQRFDPGHNRIKPPSTSEGTGQVRTKAPDVKTTPAIEAGAAEVSQAPVIKKKDVHFSNTRQCKVNKISELNCDYFIDDLLEVFEEPHFPINTKTLNLMDKLDEITIKYNGRFYLAKDSRMSKQTLLDSEKRLESYRAYRDKIKSEKIFNSVQSVRLGL